MRDCTAALADKNHLARPSSTLRIIRKRGLAVDGYRVEARVESTHFVVMGIRHDDRRADAHKPPSDHRETDLVVPSEQRPVVFNESVVVVTGHVRRIEVHKVATLHAFERRFKVTDADPCARSAQGIRARP